MLLLFLPVHASEQGNVIGLFAAMVSVMAHLIIKKQFFV